ncbi:MAG: tail fiber domain-containing protein [Bacteroidales bacterium]|nr:tail fiber domain-containing protein [Bacteroidales bacterium]
MKKILLLVAVMVTLGFSAFAQINMNATGNVGIGGIATSTKLTIRDANSLIRFTNGNGYNWVMGNYPTSTSGGANAFRLYDESSNKNVIDFRMNGTGTYLYTPLFITGNLSVSNDLTVSHNLNVANNLTVLNLNVSNSLTVPNNLTVPNLNVSNNLTAPDLSVSNSITCDNLNAISNLNVATYGWIYRNWAAAGFDLNSNRPNTNLGFLFENTYSRSSGYYCDRDYAAIWSPGNYNRLLRIWDTDSILEKFYLNRNGVPFYMSDKERKENIEPIKGSLDKIKNLEGVTFDYIKTKKEWMTDDSIFNGLIPYAGKIEDYRRNIEKKDCGFIAQDLEKVIPEVVETDEKGSKFVNYDGIIPFLVEAMKEQQAIIESLQIQIQELKGGTRGSTLNDPKVSEAQKNILYQNIPNPFSQSTVIEYTIAGNAKNAMICIYNMNGNQLKCNPINPAGHGSIVINGSELSAGMYLYSLIVDGQLIDTKRMVLTN